MKNTANPEITLSFDKDSGEHARNTETSAELKTNEDIVQQFLSKDVSIELTEKIQGDIHDKLQSEDVRVTSLVQAQQTDSNISPVLVQPEKPCPETYQSFAKEVGVRLIATPPEIRRAGNKKRDFLEDHSRFMQSLNTKIFRRTLGGRLMDYYALLTAVLELGGIQYVISSRSLLAVARKLELPKTCTSAAFVLKKEYEKYLFAYEQKLVWNRDPHQLPILSTKNFSPKDLMARGVKRCPGNAPSNVRLVSRSQISQVKKFRTIRPGQGMHSLSSFGFAILPNSSSTHNQVTFEAPKNPTPFDSDLKGNSDDSAHNCLRIDPGVNISDLTPRQEAYVEEETSNLQMLLLRTLQQRLRVVQAVNSANCDDVMIALGRLNLLSADLRNIFILEEFPGILQALCAIIARHMEDVDRTRVGGIPLSIELQDTNAPRVSPMLAMNIINAGNEAMSLGETHKFGETKSMTSLQQYDGLFNVSDPIFVNREQCAILAISILRNASLNDRNAQFLASSKVVIDVSADILLNFKVPSLLRHNLIVVWTNVAPFLNSGENHCGNVVLKTCVKLLDSHLEGANINRFLRVCEVLARLASSPARNEEAFNSEFPDLLPRLVDLINEQGHRIISAGLAVLYNCSMFDLYIRRRIAKQIRCMPRLISLLSDRLHGAKAALIINNLAEAPSNRAIILAFEDKFIEMVSSGSPLTDCIASILFNLRDH